MRRYRIGSSFTVRRLTRQRISALGLSTVREAKRYMRLISSNRLAVCRRCNRINAVSGENGQTRFPQGPLVDRQMQ